MGVVYGGSLCCDGIDSTLERTVSTLSGACVTVLRAVLGRYPYTRHGIAQCEKGEGL